VGAGSSLIRDRGASARRQRRPGGGEHRRGVRELRACEPGEFFRQLFGGALQRAQEQGRLSAPEVATWLEPLESASRQGRFFAALTGFIVAGRKR
jgi:hypothetical protein